MGFVHVPSTSAAAGIFVAGLRMIAASSGHDGFDVVTPSEGLTVISERTYTVEWTGNFAQSHVQIDLYHCGPDCGEDDCGDWITALCPYAETGCPVNDGDYDVVMPMPMPGGSASTYKVRVTDVDDESNWSCSGGFKLMSVEDGEVDQGSDFQAGLTVLSPEDGDMAHAGEMYTVMFDYLNEVGSSADRFSIDLYEARGDEGDCGTYVDTVCDKPSIGCRDSKGDYDVVIPTSVPAGEYRIRVGVFENSAVYDCSGTFVVLSDNFEGSDDSVDDVESLDVLFDDDDAFISYGFHF